MNHTTKILFYLRNSRVNKKGEAPIYMRVTINGKRIDLAISRYIDPDKWSSSAGAWKGNLKEAPTPSYSFSTQYKL